nr:MAG: Terminase small subunit [Bacteriophage sp.]
MNKNESAEKDYMSGMKYKDIADKYGVSINTVKSWKKRYNWERKKGCTQNKKGCTQKKLEKKAVADEVKQVIQNTDLTDKQQLFCIHYIRCFNATKAYQKAYGCGYTTAVTNGPALLGNTRIKEEILQLKQDRLNREFLSESDIFQKYMDIAFADINDFVDISAGFVTAKDGIDGTIVSEVSNTQSGVKIKLADRMKALQWLTDHMDLATEKQKAEIALLKAKVQTDDGEEIADDGFLDALNGTAAEDWGDEEN